MREASVSIAFRVASSAGRRSEAAAAWRSTATVAAVRGHRKRQAAERLALGTGYEDPGLVFCRKHGTPRHPERVLQAFRGHSSSPGCRASR
jgi:hypothetical protein